MSIDAMKWAFEVAETGRLTTGQAFVLLQLGNHADSDWTCYPGQELLAQRTAMSVRSVQRQLAQLQEIGLISVFPVYSGNGAKGRTGSRYQLHEDVLIELGGTPKRSRRIPRHDNLSPNSENRMVPRHDNLSPNSDLHDTSDEMGDNRESADYKDRARTNPQEPSVSQSVRQSGSVRGTSTDEDGPTMTDEPEDGLVREVHRGVDLLDLVARVPAAGQLETSQVRAIVNVVLARASGPVRKPTAFVARSLASEFEELVSVTRPRPVFVPASSPEVTTPGVRSGQVREGRSGEPCQDPGVHVGAYGTKVLQDCPHCRLERRLQSRPLAQAEG